MKLCVFQGTFNPIHNAHLKVCEYIKNHTECEKILLIPAQKPPHKNVGEELCTHRLKMAELASGEKDYLEVSDIEYRRSDVSYTFYTIKELYEQYRGEIEGKINFIIGTDAFKNIEKWHRAGELKELVNFILFLREDEHYFDEKFFEKLSKKGYNYTLMKLPFKDISSTMIRENAGQSLPISGLVPKTVEAYINKHGLYKN